MSKDQDQYTEDFKKKKLDSLLSEMQRGPKSIKGNEDISKEIEKLPPSTTKTPSELKKEMLFLKKGGKVESASKRADGIAQRGKTRGRII